MINVIIIDDEPIIREGIYRLVSQISGFNVVETYRNGEQALPQILKAPPDLIISDIVMPKMDGIELLRSLRENNICSEVILLSGYREFEYARSAIKYRVFEYINKPINHNLLIETLVLVEQKINSTKEPELTFEGQIGGIIKFIDENYYKDISVKTTAAKFFLNESYLSRIFKEKTGVRFTDYLISIRMKKAMQLISLNRYKIYEISEMVGYNSTKYFSKAFSKYTGMTPQQYKSTGDPVLRD